jgi:predicted dehydrogenase
VKVGLVGCGDIGMSQHLPALARDPRVRIEAVADVSQDRATRAAHAFGVPHAFTDAARVMGMGLDAVVLATPPQVTCRLAIDALHSGLDVLCEKPIATTLKDADAVVQAVSQTGRVLQVGFKNRFSPLVRRMKAWIDEARPGSPLVVRIGVFDEAYDPSDETSTRRIRGFMEHGPPIVHEGSHPLDLMNWIFGRPTTVTAVAVQSDPSFPAPNYHLATAHYGGRTTLKLEVGWWWPSIIKGEFHMFGPHGSIDLSREGGYVTFHDGEHEDRHSDDEDWMEVCFRGQLDGFIRACQGEPQVGATAKEARDVLEVTLAIVEAAERSEPVTISAERQPLL